MSADAVTEEFQRICALGDLERETATQFTVNDIEIAVARTETGDVYAVNDICSHGQVSLSEGEVEGCMLECWLHGSRFDLRTGKPDCLPATQPIDTYTVKIDGDDVFVAVPTN